MASVSSAKAASSAPGEAVVRTPDLGGDSTTAQVTQVILEKLEQP